MKFHLGHLLGFSAIIVAGCAAFFSVYGLSQLFAGASLAVIVMASALEFSKLVAATFLHQYWNKVSKVLRIYLTVGVVVLVTITSAGIYGFLSNAYQKTAFTLEVHEGEVGIVQGKMDIFQNKLDNNKKLMDAKNQRILQLSELRTKQEVRLDSMINRRYFSNADATRSEITNANTEIQKLTAEVDGLVVANSAINDSIGTYQISKLEMQSNSEVAAEVGPLKYMAELLNKPMDVIVNYFILLLIFVFDPLAISLVIATSWVFLNRKEEALKKSQIKEATDDSNELREVMEKAREIMEDAHQKNEYKSDLHMTGELNLAGSRWEKAHEWGNSSTEPYKGFQVIDAEAELTKMLQEEIDNAVAEEKEEVKEEPLVSCHCDDDEMRHDCYVNCDYGYVEEEAIALETEVEEEVIPEPVMEEKPIEVAPTPPVRKPITIDDIKKVTEKRGFSVDIPKNVTNKVERIGSNKFLEDNKKVFYKNRNGNI